MVKVDGDLRRGTDEREWYYEFQPRFSTCILSLSAIVCDSYYGLVLDESYSSHNVRSLVWPATSDSLQLGFVPS